MSIGKIKINNIFLNYIIGKQSIMVEIRSKWDKNENIGI